MKLCVNVDHVATVRQARRTVEPDPIAAAILALKAGAYGITIHLREDRRHINDMDLRRMKDSIQAKLNLEMAATDEIINIALETKPDQVTLVPEKREELTTEGGLNVVSLEQKLSGIVDRFKKAGIPVSLFVDPHRQQIEACARLGVESIEINTGSYSEADSKEEFEKEFCLIQEGVSFGIASGLRVHAGHGLNYVNIQKIATISEIDELNIGHSIVARAVIVGMEKAVQEMGAFLNIS